MFPPRESTIWRHELDRLRWLGVWLPVTAVAVLIGLAEGVLAYLHQPWRSTLLAHGVLLGAIAAGAYLFSTYLVGVLRRKEEAIIQTQQELAARERRFRALIEHSADGIVLLNAQGVYTYASPATTRLLGYSPADLVGRSAFDFIHPDDRGTALARTLEALQQPGAVLHAEVRLRHQDGSWRWIEATVSNLLADPSVSALVKNYRDITARKETEAALRQAHAELEARVGARTADLVQANAALQATLAERAQAEAALRESQAQLAGIIASALDAILTVDEQQRIVVFNAAAERLFGVAAADALGQPVQRFIPARFRPTHQAGLAAFARSNVETWWVGMLGGATGRRPGGEEFPFESAISQVEVGGRKLFTILLHDLTAQREAEAQLRQSQEQMRALAARLQSVREDERSRIARDIQDTLGQALAVLKMDLAWLASRLTGAQAALAERVKSMLALANTSIHSVRRIATDLRPGVLDDLGLVAAIEWQAQDFQARTGIQCQFTKDQIEPTVPPAVGVPLFRICQEALTNVARHTRASRVAITLGEEKECLVLTVTDNGRGITEQELASRTSLGLLGMRERALLLGGDVTIVGRPGEGTMVTVRIPLDVPGAQDVSEPSRKEYPTSGAPS